MPKRKSGQIDIKQEHGLRWNFRNISKTRSYHKASTSFFYYCFFRSCMASDFLRSNKLPPEQTLLRGLTQIEFNFYLFFTSNFWTFSLGRIPLSRKTNDSKSSDPTSSLKSAISTLKDGQESV